VVFSVVSIMLGALGIWQYFVLIAIGFLYILLLIPLRPLLLRLVPEENFLGVITAERLRELSVLPITDEEYASALWAQYVRRWPLRAMRFPIALTFLGCFATYISMESYDLFIARALPFLVAIPAIWMSFVMRYRSLPYSALNDAAAEAGRLMLEYQGRSETVSETISGFVGEGSIQSGAALINVFAPMAFVAFIGIVIGGGSEFVGIHEMKVGQMIAFTIAVWVSTSYAVFVFTRWTINLDRESASGYFRSMSRDLGQLRRWLLIDADKAKGPDQS